jgi:hypothetical protein
MLFRIESVENVDYSTRQAHLLSLAAQVPIRLADGTASVTLSVVFIPENREISDKLEAGKIVEINFPDPDLAGS